MMLPILKISVEQKKKELQSVLDNLKENDSVAIIVSKNSEKGGVESRTHTFIHPNHLMAQRNTALDLAENLKKAMTDYAAGMN